MIGNMMDQWELPKSWEKLSNEVDKRRKWVYNGYISLKRGLYEGH